MCIRDRARAAGFDERLSLIGLLLDGVTGQIREVIDGKKILEQLMQVLKQFRVQAVKTGKAPGEILEQLRDAQADKLAKGRKAGSLSADGQAQGETLLGILEEDLERIAPVSYTHLDVYKRQKYFPIFDKQHPIGVTGGFYRVGHHQNSLSLCIDFAEGLQQIIR